MEQDANDRLAFEITDEMIAEGLEALREFDLDFDSAADAIVAVYRAMQSASPSPKALA